MKRKDRILSVLKDARASLDFYIRGLEDGSIVEVGHLLGLSDELRRAAFMLQYARGAEHHAAGYVDALGDE